MKMNNLPLGATNIETIRKTTIMAINPLKIFLLKATSGSLYTNVFSFISCHSNYSNTLFFTSIVKEVM